MTPVFHCDKIPFLFWIATILCWPGVVLAQALQIMPVTLALPSGQLTATVFVVNRSAEPQTVQARPFLWRQSDGTDTLTPTEALAVSPPMTVIAAGATQVFRILLRQPAQTVESTYRLIFDEIPPPIDSVGGVRLTLRVSMPVFAQPALPTASAVQWSVLLDGAGAFLHAENHGSQHLHVIHPVLNENADPALGVPAASTCYILAGAVQDWRIKGGGRLEPGSIVRLTASSDQGSVDAMVHVRQR
jgi:fimbrial chaperone protein